MNLDAKTITIGVMTAMGESSLINIDRGDGAGPDSRGLFQQRDNGVWGSYSDRMNPTIASTNFFKALIAVPNYLELEPTIAGPGAPPPTADGSGQAIVAAAKHYIATPYAWGGGDINGPSVGTYSSTGGGRVVGFDCSGLVLFAVYNATGIDLAHSAERQGRDSRGSVVARDWGKSGPVT